MLSGEGLMAVAIAFPAVLKGKARIRIHRASDHTPGSTKLLGILDKSVLKWES